MRCIWPSIQMTRKLAPSTSNIIHMMVDAYKALTTLRVKYLKKKAPAIGATYILVHSVNTRRQLVCQTEIHVLQDLMEK